VHISTFVKSTAHFWENHSALLSKVQRTFGKITAYFCQKDSVLLGKGQRTFGKITVSVTEYLDAMKKALNELDRMPLQQAAARFPVPACMDKTHIQLCIVDPSCIMGYFNPITVDRQYPLP